MASAPWSACESEANCEKLSIHQQFEDRALLRIPLRERGVRQEEPATARARKESKVRA